MQPLGREPIQLPNAKHHPKFEGKNIEGWWEDRGDGSKTSARFKAKQDIKAILDRTS